MSHELRTPLTAIPGYTDVLIDDERVKKDQRESLETIKRNSHHLLGMVDMMLDLCQMETGHLQAESEPVDLVGMMNRVARDVQPRARKRNIEITVEFSSAVPPLVLSDAKRIRQAFLNLIGNGIKFTERGSVRVRLHYDEPDSMVQIEVVDTGIGILPDVIPSLFLEFEQADASTSKRYGGAGLGLAFTRRLARLLGGSCTLESQQGIGTSVLMSFRAPRVAEADPQRAAHEAASTGAPHAVPEARSRLRILLVEDGVDNQKLISLILSKAGADVEIAENGRIAVDRLAAGACFDLIFMDMAMPEMDGYSATRALRSMGCRLPIVALTAHGLQGEREKCLAAGCDEYATKPISKKELIRIARSVLGKRVQRRA
jgi:CheY-like chemotaxis protein